MKKLLISVPLRKKLLALLLLSIMLSLAVELFVFGFPSDFFTRWLRTFFVILYMLAVPVLGILPLVNYIFKRWIKK